ncbi:MAG: OmpA family protein [Gammaproteobacteria bacterium]|jgi:outer membrane protein OmpA-like peptidoglycan-associated protein
MKKLLLVLVSAAIVLAGCAGMNNQQRGAIGGAVAGAAAGALVSDNIWGVLIGAAVGGTAGTLIGKHMDEQARELAQAVPTAEVQRVGEGINMTFASGLVFPINSAELQESYKDDLRAAAEVFAKYDDTNILVEGHTDDTGPDTYNMTLSGKRAQTVASYLQSQGISASRITTEAFGENQPKYPNDSEANRSKNRRVELAIYANEDMKAAARAGSL